MSLSIIGSESAYWIDPSGKKYELKSLTHDEWAKNTLGKTQSKLLKEGWVRVRFNLQESPYISIQVDSINNLYDFVDELIYQNPVYLIIVETHDKNYSIYYPEFIDSGKSLKSFIESKSLIGSSASLKGEYMNNDFIKELIKEANFFNDVKDTNPIGIEFKYNNTSIENNKNFKSVQEVKALPDEFRQLISDINLLKEKWNELKKRQEEYEKAKVFLKSKIDEFFRNTYMSVKSLLDDEKVKSVTDLKLDLGERLNNEKLKEYEAEQEVVEDTLLKIKELNTIIEEKFNASVFELYDKLEDNVLYVDKVLKATGAEITEVTYFIGRMKRLSSSELYDNFKNAFENAIEKVIEIMPSAHVVVNLIKKFVGEFSVLNVEADKKYQSVVTIFESGQINKYTSVFFDEPAQKFFLDPNVSNTITELKFKHKYPDKDFEKEIKDRLEKIMDEKEGMTLDEAKQILLKQLVQELDPPTYLSKYEGKSRYYLLTVFNKEAKKWFKEYLKLKNPELAKDEKALDEEAEKEMKKYFSHSKDIQDLVQEIESIPGPSVKDLNNLLKQLEELDNLKKQIKSGYLYNPKKIELISKLLESNYDFDTTINLIAELSDIDIPELDELSKALKNLNSKAELIASELNKLQKLISNIKEALKELKNIEAEVDKNEHSIFNTMRNLVQPEQEIALAPASLKNKIDIK
jgi:prefoldin subunit 5